MKRDERTDNKERTKENENIHPPFGPFEVDATSSAPLCVTMSLPIQHPLDASSVHKECL